jgi:hypothetical protein
MSAMDESVKRQLAERRAERAQAAWERRLEESRRFIEAARARDRRRVDAMREAYFRRRFGDRWREAMASRAAGVDPGAAAEGRLF